MQRPRHLTVVIAIVFLGNGVDRPAAQALDDPQAFSSARFESENLSLSEWTTTRMLRAAPVRLPTIDLAVVRGGAPFEESDSGPDARGESPASDRGLNRFSGDVRQKPLIWAGKLFFGNGSYCSAQFITDQVILTAAHCVRSGKTGRFYDHFLFALQYNDGKWSNRYGTRCAATHNGYIDPGVKNDELITDKQAPWDYAMLLIAGNTTTGHFGYQWGWNGQYRSAVRIGYPSGLIRGQVIQVDRGPLSIRGGVVELQHGVRANPHGSSGGAWIGDYNGGDHAISVVSFSQDNRPGVAFGPYFRAPFKDLLNYTQRGCR